MKRIKELFKKVLLKFKRPRPEKEEKKEKEKTVIVLDTSALQSQKGMQIVDVAERVVLLTGTIRELDKYKKDEGLFGTNIRIVSRRCREDLNQKKYICVEGYESSAYQDDNIIAYCKENRNAVILTADNNLCNLAKAYGITYIYVEPPEQTPQNEASKHQEERKEEKKKEYKECKEVEDEEEHKLLEKRQYIKGAFFKDESLYIHKSTWMIYNFVYRNGEMLKERSHFIKLQEGDVVFQIRLETSFIKVLKYEIDSIKENGYAKYLTHINIDSYSELADNLKEKVPYEVLRKITIMRSSLKLHDSTFRVTMSDAIILRDGKPIENKNEYRQADKIYKIKRIKSSKYLLITEYEVILNDGMYELIELNEYHICYLNDIFKYRFPDALEEKIREEYLDAINY